MRRWIGAAAASLLLFLPMQAVEPDRSVVDGSVISRRDPAVTVTLSKAFRYVGTDRFLLHDPKLGDFDDCQLFAFVAADRRKAAQKIGWVQFEAYLPNHPDLHHTYDSPRHTRIGGLDFFVDTWVSAGATPPERGSDEAHFYALLASHGYHRVPMMFVRLVHLTDATRRKELMVIYGEALPPGTTATALRKGGADEAKWRRIEPGLIDRTERSIRIKTRHRRGG